MQVIKRDGTPQDIDFEKIHWRIKSMCAKPDILEFQKKERPDSYNVFSHLPPISYANVDLITQKTIEGLYNNISTTEIDKLSAEIAQEMCIVHPDNSVLATRLLVSNLHKNILEIMIKRYPEVSQEIIQRNLFKYVMNTLYFNLDNHHEQSPLVAPYLAAIADKYNERISDILQHCRDYLHYDYLGIKTLEKGYLFTVNEMEGFSEKTLIVETPSISDMRIAIALACAPTPCPVPYSDVNEFIRNHPEVVKDKYREQLNDITSHTDKRLKTKLFKTLYWEYTLRKMKEEVIVTEEQWEHITENYNRMSTGKFTPATPTRFAAGSLRPQGSSCFLIAMQDDSLNGIYDTLKEQSQISKHAGGVAIWLTNIRATNSYISGTNGRSNGIKPMLQVFNASSHYVDQGGGRRAGSIAVYLEPWHADILDFIYLKLKKGADTDRARELFYALWIPDEFFRCVKEKKDWYLFDPAICPKLYDSYDEKFCSTYLTDEYVSEHKHDFLFTYRYRKYIRQNKFVSKTTAEYLLDEVVKTVRDSGVPYMLAKDACNRKSNQKNLGVIKSSNLCTEIIQYSDDKETSVCLTGDTEILTRNGVKKIVDCDGEDVLCYFDNDIDLKEDQHFEKAQLIDNGVRNVYEIKTCCNKPIKATSNHLFLTRKSIKYPSSVGRKVVHEWKTVEDLEVGDYLMFPQLNTLPGYDVDIVNNYDVEYLSAGWMLGDGWMTKKAYGVCFGPKETFASDIVTTQMNKWQQSVKVIKNGRDKTVTNYVQPNGVINWHCSKTNFKLLLNEKFGFKEAKGPTKTLSDKIKTANPIHLASFLSGLFSADGTITYNNKKPMVGLSSASEELLHDVQQCLNLFGIHSTITFNEVKGRDRWQGCLSIFKEINLVRFQKYINFYLCPEKRNKLETLLQKMICKRDINKDYKKVESIEYLGKEHVYDLSLPTSHNFLANGCVVHNCNLSSICLNKFVRPFVDGDNENFKYNVSFDDNENYYTFDFEDFDQTVRLTITNINRLIDLNYYPTEKARISNFKHRNCGIGVQGEADMFALLKIPWNSKEARRLRFYIFERMYYEALHRSMELSAEFGPYSSFQGSPASLGKLQFDLWKDEGKTISFPFSMPWDDLKKEILNHGLRNSTQLSLMPTASTSSIMGNNPSFEPFNSLVYVRKSNTGDITVFNRNLVKDLMSVNMWNVEIRDAILKNHGSIKDIVKIPKKLRDSYLTAYDLEPEDIIDAAYVRGWFVDQSQSMNLFVKNSNMAELSKAWTRGWMRGLKTLSYYIRSRPSVVGQKAQISTTTSSSSETNPLSPSRETIVNKQNNKEEKIPGVCYRDDPTCLSCGS